MKSYVCLLFFISSCYCAIEFEERPRNFSIELLYHTQKELDGHVVISPFGIWTLMTGVALGATGESYNQLRHAFFLPKNSKSLIKGYQNLTKIVLNSTPTTGVSLASKNFVFLDDKFNVYPAFRSTIQQDFDASVKVLDFNDPNSVRVANAYIEKSGARVSNVLKSEDFRESKMILSNVISFKGLWSYQFMKNDTVLEPFYNEDREVIGSVNMMFQKAPVPFSNMQNLKAFVVELPYGNDNKYSMIFILPYPKVKIADMYQSFETIGLKDIYKKLQQDVDSFGLEDIDVKIPRFQISTNIVLNKPLNAMGVYDIFQPDLAKFGKVSKDEIYVSAIVHKAEIEVTESGTVASAITSALFTDRISPPYFQANRPFLYFLMEKSTTTAIFAGIYSKPSVY